MRTVYLLLLASLVACSRGGLPDGEPSPDLTPAADGAAALDLAAAPDLPACVTTFTCDARTAEHECGVTTATGQRHPDKGAPYCRDKVNTWSGCSCDLLRCTSPAPLCPGDYRATFSERLLAGCNGVAGQQDGTCAALLNQVLGLPGGTKIAEDPLLNVSMSFGPADYAVDFQVIAPLDVRLVVKQNCWLADVSGVGNAGRAEVSAARVAPR